MIAQRMNKPRTNLPEPTGHLAKADFILQAWQPTLARRRQPRRLSDEPCLRASRLGRRWPAREAKPDAAHWRFARAHLQRGPSGQSHRAFAFSRGRPMVGSGSTRRVIGCEANLSDSTVASHWHRRGLSTRFADKSHSCR
jgi:hypothetical protein